MNLAEIFTALPVYHTNILEQHLEEIKVSENPTKEEVRAAAQVAVNTTLDDIGPIPEEYSEIMKQVPDAVVLHLFS